VKKVVLKMEKQREEYEQKALKAIQRAENEKAEAQSKMEYLQVRLHMHRSKVSIFIFIYFVINILYHHEDRALALRTPSWVVKMQSSLPLGGAADSTHRVRMVAGAV